MTQSIHGHNVLKLVFENENAWAKDQLLQAMNERFGLDAIFHTCSAQDLDAAGLVEPFLGKGKLAAVEGGLVGRSCGCGGH